MSGRDPVSGKFSKKDGATRKYVKKVARKVKASAPDQVTVGGENAAASLPNQPAGSTDTAEYFPTAYLSAADERDLMMQTRLQLGNELGQQQFKEQDAEWLLKKIRAAKDADFQAWFAKNYDKSSVTAKAWGREVFPEYYKQRLATLDINLDTLRKLARIKIRGVETPEDVALQYAADQGLLPMEQLQNILHGGGETGVATQQARFQRGLFNINTFFDGSRVGRGVQDLDRSAYYGRNDVGTASRFSDPVAAPGGPAAAIPSAQTARRAKVLLGTL